jgi:hypothetical protein
VRANTDIKCRFTFVLALALAGCGDAGAVPVPNLGDPLCAWAVHAEIAPAPECRRFENKPGADAARFLTEADTTCDGARALELPAGERAWVLGSWGEAFVDYDQTGCD